MRTRSHAASISSAAIIARPVCDPCPISQCGTRMVTTLSGVTVIQVVSSPFSIASAETPLWRPGTNATPATPRTNPPPTRLPAPMKERPVHFTHDAPPSCPRSCRRRWRESRAAPGRRAVATDVGDRGVDLLVARIRPLGEERRHGHDHAGLAVGALRHLVVYPGLLHRVQLAVLLERLDGRDRHPLGGGDRRGAGTDGPSVEVHGAGPAGRDAAPELGARQAERVPEQPQQRRVGFHAHRGSVRSL